METERIRRYAELLVKTGLNPDRDQEVFISAEPEAAELVRMAAEECYKLGVRKVTADWRFQPLTRLSSDYCTLETLSRVEEWEKAKMEWRKNTLPAYLYLISEDPNGLKGCDQQKRTSAMAARFPVMKPFIDAMENRYQWCIGAYPGKAWAKTVFPALSEAEAVERLWELILETSRANGDPIANWKGHNRNFEKRCAFLNDHRFTALEYKASNGTDLTVGLMPEGLFEGGCETDLSGRVFNPNIPSEEIFTTPCRGRVEGIVHATKPLSWQGELIENFSVRFENGKVAEVHAEQGEALLKKMVSMDEGAAYLGECALIACGTPIDRTGILFYETLFDENASCHLALGRGFSNCVRDYGKYTKKELDQMGVNDSMIHVDFMIGCPELDITGLCADGTRIPVFRQGKWAF